MFNRQDRKVDNTAAINETIQQIDSVKNALDGLNSRFPVPQRTAVSEEEDIPFGAAPRGKAFPSPQDRAEATTASAPAPKTQPRPAPRPEPKRTELRPSVLLPRESEPFIEPLPRHRAKAPTWKFVLNNLQIALNLTAVGWVLSPKGLGSYVALQSLVALLGIPFWTPGVLAALFCLGVYARHAGRDRLFEISWQATIAFIVAKLIAHVFFGGSW